ncbi:uncharacterized protein LOC134180896 [Corticium candelabrum]|uniref:uncharacterized protein LOC134180896 n=1 Tax=Corticium candelabrum TaxID=121492 RepID=UPI002E26D707|nr:uncharacterized protein LOC134180896 [Corticium candelabrum]
MASAHPVSFFASSCLILPDENEIGEGEEVNLVDVDDDATYGTVVCGVRRYFSHQRQQVATSHYRFPIDLEVNFSMSAPSKLRYLTIEIVHQLKLPRRVRIDGPRKVAYEITELRPQPRPPTKLQLQKLEKRYFVVANNIKTGRVFAVPVNKKRQVLFTVKGEDTRPNKVDDHAHLLYGLVDFCGLPRIGNNETNSMFYEDPLPVVKVSPRPEITRQRIQSSKKCYQLIPTYENDRIAVVFASKDLDMSSQTPSSYGTIPREVHFYETLRGSSSNNALFVKKYEPPFAKRNVNLENAALEYQLNQLKQQVLQAELDQLAIVKTKSKDLYSSPVLSPRAMMFDILNRKPVLTQRVTVECSPPTNSKQVMKREVDLTKILQSNPLENKEKFKLLSLTGSPHPIQCKVDTRLPRLPPVTAKPELPLHSTSRLQDTEQYLNVPEAGAYIKILGEEGNQSSEEFGAEEKKNQIPIAEKRQNQCYHRIQSLDDESP